MKELILNLLNENKRNVFFVRIPLNVTNKMLPIIMEQQKGIVFDLVPRKYAIVIQVEGNFFKLDPFKFITISENIFEFKKQISEYYPDDNSYRFFYDEKDKGFFLDFDDLNGWNQYCLDSRKNLKDELWGKEEDE